MFVHGGILHILFNMLFLFVFGPEIEYLCGHVRFLAFYLICGIAGGIAQVAVGPGSHVPEIGASGAIAGVLGAYLINFPTASINTIVPIGCFPLFLRLPAILVIGLWALTQFVTGFGSLSERVGERHGRRNRLLRAHRRFQRWRHPDRPLQAPASGDAPLSLVLLAHGDEHGRRAQHLHHDRRRRARARAAGPRRTAAAAAKRRRARDRQSDRYPPRGELRGDDPLAARLRPLEPARCGSPAWTMSRTSTSTS